MCIHDGTCIYDKQNSLSVIGCKIVLKIIKGSNRDCCFNYQRLTPVTRRLRKYGVWSKIFFSNNGSCYLLAIIVAIPDTYTHLRAQETGRNLVRRLMLLKKEYHQICSLDKNSFGAEARYQLASLSFIEEDFQACEAGVFDLAENYFDDYFIAKGFILLSDVYVKQENYFQAKATLQSIIDNYQGEELINIAVTKFNYVVAIEESLNSPDKDNELIIDLLIDFDEEEINSEDEE